MIYSILYFLMYASSFIGMQYINIYYKDLNYNNNEISIIIIVSTMITILSSTFWGYKFDRTTKKGILIYILLFG
ncbi:MAG: MFS transporter, partial [Coprobacillaceae bacterium]